jgi:tetratricopeptide (TPR) repeat protein
MSRVVRNCVFWASAAVLPMQAISQDLGSSNKLFGAPTKKTAEAEKASDRKLVKARSSGSRKKRAAPVKATPTGVRTERTDVAMPVPPEAGKMGSEAPAKPGMAEAPPDSKRKAETAEKLDPEAVKRFEDLIELGNLERDRRGYVAAETAYRQAKTLKPGDPRADQGLGDLYSGQLRWQDAENAYRTALKIEPNAGSALVALSYVLTQPVAAPDLVERYREAEGLARKAIKLAPGNARAFDQLGVALEMRGFFDAGTENAYRSALKLDPLFAPVHAHLGRLLRRRGLIDESETAYATAVRLSGVVATKIVVANVLQSDMRFAESAELLRRAVLDDPRNPATLMLLGRALTALGKFDEAENALKSSLSSGANDFMANSLLGTLYLRQDNAELAGNALLQALKFVSSNEKGSLARQFESVGDVYIRMARRREAEQAYRQAMALDPQCRSISAKLASIR